MSEKTRRRLLVLLWSFAVVALAFDFWRAAALGSLSLDDIVPVLIFFSGLGVVGTLIVTRQPRNPVGWTFLAAFCFSITNAFLESLLYVYLELYPETAASSIAIVYLQLFMGELLNVAVWFSLLFFPILYFPNGQLPSPRWRYLVRLFLALLIVWIAAGALNPQLPDEHGLEYEVPLSVPAAAAIFDVANSLLVLIVLIPPIQLVIRFRKATGVERQQIKWPLFSALIGALGIGWTIVAELFGAQQGDPLAQPSVILEALSVVSYPITIGIAILRYRLYDIDILIRRTLVYSGVTLILALIYFGSVVLLQQLFVGLVGRQEPAAIVISTLLIAALFAPLRRRVQAFIDRRFYRRKYDAAQTLARFAAAARDEVDLDELTTELINVVQETVHPERIGVWLKEET